MRILLRQLRLIRGWLSAGLLLAILNAASDLFLPTVMADIVDIGISSGDRAYLGRMAGIMLCAAAAAVCIKYLKNVCAIKSGNGYARNMRRALFHHVTRFSQTDMDKKFKRIVS